MLERLLVALKNNDRQELIILFYAFAAIKEAMCGSDNTQFMDLILDMEYAAQEAAMGVKGRYSASVEEIKAALKAI